MVQHLKTWLTLYSGKAYPLLHIYYSHKPEWNSQWLNQKEPMVHFINDIRNRGALFVCENTSCASFCTHCQRTKSLDKTNAITSTDIDKGLYYLSKNSNINEVLVTGGDALRTSRERLEYVISELCKIPHIHCIRIATRMPVVLPMAVTDEFLDKIDNIVNKSLKGERKNIYFMTHINHYNEITEDLVECVSKIKKHGYLLRNQTVFLNHVNADFYTLAETFRRMWWAGVEPYYLLQCHNEKGLTHFIAPGTSR